MENTRRSMQRKLLPIAGILNVTIGLLYFPGTPWYVLGTLQETEILVWASGAILFSIPLLVPPSSHAGQQRKWGLLPLCILAFLHLGAFFAYWMFLPETVRGSIGESPFHQAILSWIWLIIHGGMLLFLIVLTIMLFFGKTAPRAPLKNR